MPFNVHSPQQRPRYLKVLEPRFRARDTEATSVSGDSLQSPSGMPRSMRNAKFLAADNERPGRQARYTFTTSITCVETAPLLPCERVIFRAAVYIHLRYVAG